MARTLLRWYPTIDVRDVLPLVRVPTIVIHRSDDAVIGADMGRRLAELIPGGRFVLIPGSEHLFFLGDQEPLLTAVEEFVSGEIGPTFVDRFLTSVMFVDIVDSTGLASRLGDRQWTETLATFSTRSERQVDRFQGSILKSTGDGLLAIFDGPARAVACAAALREVARSLGLEIRTGIHTGEVERIGRDIGGIGVHIAARIMAEASPGEILTSSTVRDLVVGSGIEFRSKSLTQLRGMPGEWTLLSVIGDGDGPE
jgi:class 3 adenylate cyclase